MEKNELQAEWRNTHNSDQNNIYDKISIEKTLTMKHCRIISNVVSDIRLKMLVWIMVLVIYISLMLYALVYLDLNLSIYSLAPLTLIGIFIFYMTTSEIIRLLLFIKSTDSMSVKDSLLFFRKKLNRIRIIDFLTNLFFLYTMAILIVFNYISDIGGIKNLKWRNEILPLPLLAFVIIFLLLIPWIIKFQHNQRYKNILSNINDKDRILHGE